MEQQPFTGTKIKVQSNDKEVKTKRATKKGLIDHKILKHALRSTIRNKFSIIWFSVLGAINLLILVIYAFAPTFKPTSIYLATIVWFFGFGITQMIYNLVSLNKIFSMDDEIGIVSLEIRKGRGPAMIFFSRLLGQKIIIWSFMAIFMILQILACVINNNFLLQSKYLFVLAWVPIDLILTGIFLIFFALKRYRLGVGLGSVLIAFVLATPLTDMVNMIFVSTNDTISEKMTGDGNIKTYLADKVFSILNNSSDKKNNIVYKFMNELTEETLKSYISVYLTENNEKLTDKDEDISRGILALFNQGVWIDNNELFGENGTLNSAFINYDLYYDVNKNSEFTDTTFYKINEDYIAASNGEQTDNSDTIYSQITSFSYKQLKNTIKQLKEFISFLNSDNQFSNMDGIKELNELILNYASNLFYVAPSYEHMIKIDSQPIKTIFKLTENTYYYGSNSISTFATGNYDTPPGLRLWNQIVMQIIGNAVTYQNSTDFVKPSKYSSISMFDPWAMSFWTMMGGTDNSSVEFNTAISSAFSSHFNYSEMFNYSRYVNSKPTNDNTHSSYPLNLPGFELENLKATPNIKGIKYKTKGHSPAGYNITILVIGIALIGIAFAIYRARLRHQ